MEESEFGEADFFHPTSLPAFSGTGDNDKRQKYGKKIKEK